MEKKRKDIYLLEQINVKLDKIIELLNKDHRRQSESISHQRKNQFAGAVFLDSSVLEQLVIDSAVRYAERVQLGHRTDPAHEKTEYQGLNSQSR